MNQRHSMSMWMSVAAIVLGVAAWALGADGAAVAPATDASAEAAETGGAVTGETPSVEPVTTETATAEAATPEASTGQRVDPQSFYHYSLGHEHFVARRFDQAIEEFKKASDLDPTSTLILRELASAYLAKRNPDMAVQIYKRIVELDPKDVEAVYNLGRAALANGEAATASERFEKVLTIVPDPSQSRFYGLALYQLATVYDSQGAAGKAADKLSRLIAWLDDVPELVRGERELGWLAGMRKTLSAKTAQLYIRDKQTHQAVVFVTGSAKEYLGDAEFGRWLVTSLVKAEDFASAIEAGKAIVAARPMDADAYTLLAEAYDKAGNDEAFFETFRQLAKDHPDLPAINLLLGRKLLVTGHGEEGLKQIEKILDSGDVFAGEGSETVLASLVESLLEADKPELAEKVALAAQKHWPKSPQSYTLLEKVYEKSGDEKKMVERLEEFYKANPDVKTLGLMLAKHLLALDRNEEAVAILKPLLDAGSGVPDLAREVLAGYYRKVGEPARALRLYADAITHDTEDAATILRLAEFIDGLEDKPAVMAKAEPELGADREKVGPAFVLGMLAEAYDASLAADCFQKAIDAEPKFVLAYERRSAMLIQLDRLMDALDTLREAISNGLRFGAFYRRMGFIYELVDRDADAIATYRTASRIAPDDSSSLYRIPKVLIRMGQEDEARKLLEKQIEEHPGQVQPYLALAALMEETGDLPQALEVMERGLKQSPESGALLYYKAAYLRVMKKYDEADEVAAQLSTLGGLKDASERLRVSIMIARKDYERAEQVIQKRRQENPDDPQNDYLLAGMYQEMGRMEEAEKVLSGILEKHPRDASACNDLGYLRADRGVDLEKCERMIRIALQENPESSAYLDSLGWVLYKQNKIAQALVYLRRAVRMDPEIDPVVWDHLGDALVRTGRAAEAKGIYLRAQEMLDKPERRGSREDEKVRASLRQKLEAIEKGKSVPTAPLGEGVE